MSISRGQEPRQLYRGGGIMNLAPRQEYGLGSIVKSVKKAVSGAAKGIKSLAKSDLGKAALLYAGTAGLGSLGAGGGLSSLFKLGTYAPSSVFSNVGSTLFGKTIMGGNAAKGAGYFKPGLFKTAADAITGNAGMIGATVLGGVLGSLTPQEQEEISGNGGRNVEALRSKLTKAYTDLQYDPAEIPTLVANDLSEYTQDMNRTGAMYGGRMGYGGGTPYVEPDPAMMVDTTTFNPIPEDADRQQAAEIAKIMMATRGLPREEGEIEDTETMSTEDFMLNEYFKPKREELMENFGLSLEEANNLIREEAIKIRSNNANGGRMGFDNGGGIMMASSDMGDPKENAEYYSQRMFGKPYKELNADELEEFQEEMRRLMNKFMSNSGRIAEQRNMAAYGGRMGYAFGTDSPENNAIQAAGIEGLPLNQNPAGVTELDLRDSGGFIPPVGVKEKADDIPAMLANNEFVFTADAVRGMGDGNVNKGAQRMYDMMKKLENGGRV